MLPIIHYPNDILRERLPEFDFTNPITDPVKLQTDMLETMFANKGMGLSANQVGIRARVFVMGHSQHQELAQAFFNPIVVATVDSVEELEEGCLSFPGVYVKIKRPRKILARWQNAKAEWQESEFTGYDCKCFLHELDHLEGVVFQDRVSVLKWALAVKRANKRKY
jgi:peptide deformylase